MPRSLIVVGTRVATLIVVVVVIVAMARVGAQQQQQQQNVVTPPNGISVGRPKVFDNRTLTIMAESLSEALRSLQAIEQKPLLAALGTFQGSQLQQTIRSIAIGSLGTPQTSDQLVTTGGRVDAAGQPLPDGTVRTENESRAAVNPVTPALDTIPAFSGMPTSYGQSAGDLLSDQVNLQYQIFNLRMLLERSLTDRLVEKEARLQAVLGFNVTIDPPRDARDSVAVVEVTLTDPKGSVVTAAEMSLVALMPQEKTYNSAALSTKSNAFGGAAIAGMLQLGFNQQSRAQTFYVYRDADTIAYERMTTPAAGTKAALTFGWMFRPVLGRRSVSPGLRQMFAIVSLPAKDGTDAGVTLTANVRTFWKPYDRKTLTSKEELSDDTTENRTSYAGIGVETTSTYQSSLGPTVSKVSWSVTGPKTVVLSATGTNFFSGTQISLAGKTYVGGGDGLIIKSDKSFDLTAPIDVLESGTGSIIGRYGSAVELRASCTTTTSASRPSLGPVVIGPPRSGLRLVTVVIRDVPEGCERSPVLSINGSVLALGYQPSPVAGQPRTFRYETYFADSLLVDKGGRLKVAWPFLPREWTMVDALSDPDDAYRVSKLGDKQVILTTTNGFGFQVNVNPQPGAPATPVCWRLVHAGGEVTLKTPACPAGSASTVLLSESVVSITFSAAVPDRLLLISPWGSITTIDLTAAPAPKPAPPKAVEVGQFDAVWLDLTVKDARAIARVEANGTELRKRFTAAGDAPVTVLRVELTREITKEPGLIDVTFLDAKGEVAGQSQVRVVCTTKCS